MKTKNKIIIGVVIIALAAGGYSAGNVLSKKSKAKNGMEKGFNMQRDSDLPSPDRNPEIMGKIQAVNENKITIGKFEIPSNDDLTKGESEGGITQMFSGDGSKKRGMRKEMKEQKETATREIIGEETLIITSETKIFKRSNIQGASKGNGSNLEEISLDNINEGDNTTVWIKQDDANENVAEFIMITNNKE